MKNFIKSNAVLIIIELIYYIAIFSLFKEALPLMLTLHIILLFFALTPVCEALMRMLCGTNRIVTEADKKYLQPLFEEVYKETKEKYPSISKNIQLFKSKEVVPNAYALGSNTIVLTKGAIETFSSDELKGVIAHELVILLMEILG